MRLRQDEIAVSLLRGLPERGQDMSAPSPGQPAQRNRPTRSAGWSARATSAGPTGPWLGPWARKGRFGPSQCVDPSLRRPPPMMAKLASGIRPRFASTAGRAWLTGVAVGSQYGIWDRGRTHLGSWSSGPLTAAHVPARSASPCAVAAASTACRGSIKPPSAAKKPWVTARPACRTTGPHSRAHPRAGAEMHSRAHSQRGCLSRPQSAAWRA